MLLKSRLPLWVWITISIATIVIFDILNFSEMMWGNGSLASFIVSLFYTLVWVAFVFINRNDKKYLNFFKMFSIICLVAGLLGLGITSDIITNEILRTIGVIGVLFLTPLYGLRFMVLNSSFVILYTGYVLLFTICLIVSFVLLNKVNTRL